MTAAARKPDWRLALAYPCGHPRTPENTRRGKDCRTCDNARAAKARRRKGIPPRPGVDELQALFAPGPPRPRRPYLVARNFAAILEEVRPLYEAAIAPRNAPDERQIPLFPETAPCEP